MKIYFVNNIEAFDETFVKICESFFPMWRKEKMLRYKFHRGRIQNGLAYLLLIHALRKEGVFLEMPEFYYNEHGKPYLKNYPGWYFNFSHCRNAVCCVLSNEEIGIDIEEIGIYKESLAEYICNENELDLIRQSEHRADEFYKLWTMKESVFKMLGSGITKEIKHILDTPYVNIESYRIDDIWMSLAKREDSTLDDKG